MLDLSRVSDKCKDFYPPGLCLVSGSPFLPSFLKIEGFTSLDLSRVSKSQRIDLFSLFLSHWIFSELAKVKGFYPPDLCLISGSPLLSSSNPKALKNPSLTNLFYSSMSYWGFRLLRVDRFREIQIHRIFILLFGVSTLDLLVLPFSFFLDFLKIKGLELSRDLKNQRIFILVRVLELSKIEEYILLVHVLELPKIKGFILLVRVSLNLSKPNSKIEGLILLVRVSEFQKSKDTYSPGPCLRVPRNQRILNLVVRVS